MRDTGCSAPMAWVLITHLKTNNIVAQDQMGQHVTEAKTAEQFVVGVRLQHK